MTKKCDHDEISFGRCKQCGARNLTAISTVDTEEWEETPTRYFRKDGTLGPALRPRDRALQRATEKLRR